MGIFAFLTASRLKGEVTRQRDEIARLHQMLDSEAHQKQDAEKQLTDCTQQNQKLAEELGQLEERLRTQEKGSQEGKAALRQRCEEECKKIQESSDGKLREMDARLAVLRQELEDKQRQRTEATQQNIKLAEKVTKLEARLGEITASLQQSETEIQQLEGQKRSLESDLKKIMGNLNRW